MMGLKSYLKIRLLGLLGGLVSRLHASTAGEMGFEPLSGN